MFCHVAHGTKFLFVVAVHTPIPRANRKMRPAEKVRHDRKRRHQSSDMEGERVGEDGGGGAERGPETGVQKQPQEEVMTCEVVCLRSCV